MPELKERAISRLSSTASVDMKTAQKTTLYTVLTGKTAIIMHVIIRSLSASLAGGTEYDFGTGTNADTWRQNIDLSSMTATTDYIIIDQNNTKYTLCAAGDVFGIKVITGSTGAATATIDVYGYLY